MKTSFLLILAILPLACFAACPVSYEEIGGKCYAYHKDSRQNRDVADNLCVSANAHLWIVDSAAEFDQVTAHFGLKKDVKSGAAPSFWTDAYYMKGEKFIWASNGEAVNYDPEQGANRVCCSGQGCFGDLYQTGDCSAIGSVSSGAADSGYGFLSCDCHGVSTLLPPICEAEAYSCPGNGQFAVGKCGNHYWNCFDNVATLNICGLELVFNDDKKYCDFPENVASCN